MTVREAGASLASAFIAGAVERRVSIYDVDDCALCGDVGVMHKCTWEAKRLVVVDAGALKVGDEVKWLGKFRTILLVSPADAGHVFLAFELGGRVEKMRHSAEYAHFVQRLAPCAAACCDRCSCERGDGVHVCADHWLDWSKVV